ncbi:MAG: hypothetical protein WCX12_03360 [Candidatus Paceibacterota bacterium]
MQKNLLKVGAIIFLMVIFAGPVAVMAQDITQVNPPIGTTPGPSSVGGAIDWFGTILTWVARIFWIAAILFIFWAAFLYLTAAGDPEKVKKASHTLLYAVIAIVIGLMAYGIPKLVGTGLSGQ